MRQHLPNVLLFLALAAGLVGGAWYIEKTYFPKPEVKPPEPPTPARELVGALTGAVGLGAPPADAYAALPPLPPPSRATLLQSVTGGFYAAAEMTRPLAQKPPAAVKSSEPQELIALGDGSFYKKVLLNTRGASVQQVVLTRFYEANRLGLEVKRNGQSQVLRLIPGVTRPRVSLTELHANPHADDVPDLAPGKVSADLAGSLTEPSYVLLHYPVKDDPHPSVELGERTWTIVERHQPADGGEWRVVFETELGAPYFLKLRKTYTLAPKDYHVGLKLDIEPQPGRVKDAAKFRYQIAGPRHLPIEGEWYTYGYRNVMVGWRTRSGGAKRTIEDAGAVNTKHGGERVDSSVIEDGSFTYAAVGTQYFASALALDNTQDPAVAKSAWEYVRPTREPGPDDDPQLPYLSDVTFRAVSRELDPQAGEPGVSHRYLIYDGPVKVRLLWQLKDEWSVPDETIYRYMDDLTLRTMTDYHSPNFFGRLANMIWWSDLVITFTNIMHWVLGGLHSVVPSWGLSIILLTVMVRLILLLPSRKQQIMMARMQEKMAKLKPELDKLQEKYKDNPQLLQQEKARLMFAHGVNPLSTMGGCLMLFAQMPVFMGLYFCLQESVFFRLESFMGWIPNLSAPDMLAWWSEKIPFVSTPENMGGMVYLGPYFNILPLIAVALIFVQQKLTMPPPTDEQQEMQQRMMKIMIVVMAIFFYKVPAGLCLYFICSTSWALAERKLIPKPKAVRDAAGGTGPSGDGVKPTGPTKPDAPPPANGAAGGGFMSRLKSKLEEMQQQADEQSRRQIRRDEPPRPGGGDGKKKRRK
ncbi:MAG TPA: membrane protein insertase YidC [Fimbriiglobus sp.]|nr:membrane protein insertase YidC [Fimbriiglobus sp.]